MKHYNYIFTGTGLSALMTIYEMILSGKFHDKSVLMLDNNPKKSNDRTWCFWDEKAVFPSIVTKEWKVALFKDATFRRDLKLNPYHYKMIKGLDFYNLIFDVIYQQKNITFIQQAVISLKEVENHCEVQTETESYSCDKVINSIFNSRIIKNQTQYPLLQQHFVGWFIKSKEEVFDKNTATFMDFSIEQKGNTRFMYVLPTASNEALIEYTLFSKELLPKEEYEAEIQKYIQKLGITEFEIIEKEQGNIPMTSYKFWKHNSKNIVNIGSAGGWTKASTGYTFKNTTKKSKALIQFLSSENDFRKFHKTDKFWLYDLLFLDVLYGRNDLGSKVFSSMFEKGNPTLIFKFLDEETSFWEDLQVIWKCPKKLFIKALLRQLI